MREISPVLARAVVLFGLNVLSVSLVAVAMRNFLSLLFFFGASGAERREQRFRMIN